VSFTRIGFYGHVRQYHSLEAEIDAAIQEVLGTGTFVLGTKVARFEQELAGHSKMPEAVGIDSGTDALWLAFLSFLRISKYSDSCLL
jgi:dTDP-4-amino-4,6-dideoxygalactose transaminase